MEDKKLILELDDDRATVYWNFDQRYLYVQAKHFEDSKEFRESLEMEKNILAKRDGRKIIYEINELVRLSKEDRAHIRNEHIPHLVSKGLKFMALVTPHVEIMEEVFVKALRGTYAAEDLDIQFFEDMTLAEAWLIAK